MIQIENNGECCRYRYKIAVNVIGIDHVHYVRMYQQSYQSRMKRDDLTEILRK